MLNAVEHRRFHERVLDSILENNLVADLEWLIKSVYTVYLVSGEACTAAKGICIWVLAPLARPANSQFEVRAQYEISQVRLKRDIEYRNFVRYIRALDDIQD